jgi:peptide/nickel transport system permease protein
MSEALDMITSSDEIVREAEVEDTIGQRPAGLFRRALRMWRTRVGLALLVLVVGVALFGPWLAPHGETEGVGPPNKADVQGLWFGTDKIGQDVWSRFLLGGRSILLFAIVATALALLFGVLIGLFAALNRGKLDEVLMRGIDIVLALPSLLLVLVAITTIGAKTWLIIAAVAVTTTPRIARVTRGAAVSVVERDFVAAAEALGESRFRMLRSELLPNVSAPLLVEANLRLTYSIGIVSSLAFLGFATDANAANWGTMIQENRLALAVQPWGVVLPTIAIAVLTIATGLLGDGLSRANAGIDRGRSE